MCKILGIMLTVMKQILKLPSSSFILQQKCLGFTKNFFKNYTKKTTCMNAGSNLEMAGVGRTKFSL
jgi:hypothetical protein